MSSETKGTTLQSVLMFYGKNDVHVTFSDRTMAVHHNDSRSNVPITEDETTFRPSSDSISESFGFFKKGLLDTSIENQKILQN